MHTPEEIVRELFRCRLLESKDHRALRIHPAEEVPHNAIFPAGVESLQHNEQ